MSRTNANVAKKGRTAKRPREEAEINDDMLLTEVIYPLLELESGFDDFYDYFFRRSLWTLPFSLPLAPVLLQSSLEWSSFDKLFL